MAKRRILILADRPARAASLAASVTRLGHEPRLDTAGGADLTGVDLILVEGAEPPSGTAAPVLRLDRDPVAEEASVEGDRELGLRIQLALARHQTGLVAHDLEAFFDISRDMFCFLDFSGYFRRLNPAWERALGHPLETLMSRPFIEFVHPDDRERTLRQNTTVRGGGLAVGFENRYRCADGSYRWLLWNSAPDAEAGVIYAVARDITESKRAEQERIELVSRLETSLAEVRTLRDILPICSYCRKIRDDEDYWHTVESYVARHTGSRFSHGICPSCMPMAEGQVADFETDPSGR